MAAMKTIEETLNEYRVSEEQVSSVRLVKCGATVKSQSGGPDHQVRYNERFHKLTCTCKAGQEGIPCWAQRAALAKLAILSLQLRESEEAEASRDPEEVAEQSAIAALVGSGVAPEEARREVYTGSGNYDPSVRRDEKGRLIK